MISFTLLLLSFILTRSLSSKKSTGIVLLEQEEFIHRQGTAQASRFTTAELVSIESKLTDARSKSLNIELEIYESLVKNCPTFFLLRV